LFVCLFGVKGGGGDEYDFIFWGIVSVVVSWRMDVAGTEK